MNATLTAAALLLKWRNVVLNTEAPELKGNAVRAIQGLPDLASPLENADDLTAELALYDAAIDAVLHLAGYNHQDEDPHLVDAKRAVAIAQNALATREDAGDALAMLLLPAAIVIQASLRGLGLTEMIKLSPDVLPSIDKAAVAALRSTPWLNVANDRGRPAPSGSGRG